MMAAETTSEAANAPQRLLPMANTPLRTNSSLVACGAPVAIFLVSSWLQRPTQADGAVILPRMPAARRARVVPNCRLVCPMGGTQEPSGETFTVVCNQAELTIG